MQTKFVKSFALAAVISAAFSVQPTIAAEKIIKIDGSSTVYPITEAVAEEFQIKTKTKVTVGESGTGGGFKKFCRGETDISNASRPILQKEMDACKEAGVQYIELPVAFDGLTVVVNDKNNWVKSLTVEELKKIVAEAIEKTGAIETKDMGKIMAELMPKVKGKADNSEVSKIIKELLSK